MKTITLDFSGINTVDDLHDYFQKMFDLPHYYGRNMDALWDCLQCSFNENTTIILKNLHSMSCNMQPVVSTITELFEDLQNEEENVTVRLAD